MAGLLTRALTFATAPALASILGAALTVARPPSARTRSYVQHFAAGVVFAAVAVELLPDLYHRTPMAVTAGFAVGVATMLVVAAIGDRIDARGGGGATSLLVTVGIDVVVDGVLVGVAFVLGTREGVLITAALALELFVLGVATAAALPEDASAASKVGVGAALGLLLVAGVAAGVVAFGGLSGTPMAVVVAFGAAALLYLVTEELLVEAHEVPETPASTAMFFVGFLALFLVAAPH